MRIKNRYSPLVTRYSFLFLLLSIGVAVYAEENLEELRNSLLEQEQQTVSEENIAGNKGYLSSGGETKVDVEKPIVQPVIQPVVHVVSGTEAQVKELYAQAANLFSDGKFQAARIKVEEIIKINPLHIPARHLLKQIIDKEAEVTSSDNMIETKQKIVEVDKAWLPPERKGEKEEKIEEKPQIKTPQQKIMEEMASQIIPEINFTDAHIRDVLKYLSDISGINIVIDEDIFPNSQSAEKIPGTVEVTKEGQLLAAEITPTQSSLSDRITISLTDIPLIEALKYILSAKGLKYRIDEYAIVVTTPGRLASVEMETRYYYLSAGAGIFTEFAKRVKKEAKEETGAITRGLKEESKITIKDVLEESGVPFPSGSKVLLDKRTGTLIVRNTPQNLQLVEEILRMLDITPFQVEIEARFIELKQETAQELGLEWMITNDYYFGNNNQYRWDSNVTDPTYGQYHTDGMEGITKGLRYLDKDFLTDDPYKKRPIGNILSISGVLTKPEFKMILHALSQSGYTNILSAPKVTTLNNQQAQVQVVKEIIYPTEFELTPATTNDTGSVVTQPVVTPTAFTTRDAGIILNVTPSVGADKKTISLNLKPEVSKFKRWEDYGITADKAGKWNAIPIKQPIFFTQNVETNVVVHDGETVVLGGMIQENSQTREDKIPLLGDIPILGRLFRSNSEVTERINLLIFVTANLLTPTGERIRVE